MAEKYGVEGLFYCPDAWALRHHWMNVETGEVQRARCNRWECVYCGPRKVDMWRQLVKQAEPTLFLTLTKAGKTVEEAARALTTFMQALRRGRKGRGLRRVGFRPAYLVEYFAVLERHSDFERNGFHWHILIKGVDHIPHEVLKALWISATRGRLKGQEADEKEASIVHIERIRNARAIGYVTKYLTKAVMLGEKGVRRTKLRQIQAVLDPIEGQQEMVVRYVPGADGQQAATLVEGAYKYQVRLDEHGQVVTEEVTGTRESVSKARRIRYSRHFFPEAVSALRKRLFAGLEEASTEDGESVSKPVEENVAKEERSPWRLVERESEGDTEIEEYRHRRNAEVLAEVEAMREVDQEEYGRQKNELLSEVLGEVRGLKRGVYRSLRRQRLLEVLEEMNEGRSFLSRRVINIWQYQRSELRRAS
jgi:hypothetical protein